MKKILLVLICILLCGCKPEEKYVDLNMINNFIYDDISTFDFDLHSQEYLLFRASDLKMMYSKDADKKIYPASLTKLATLDTVLNLVEDLNATSSISNEQFWDLISEDASVAYIQTDYDYTIKDLLYALILPSGADAAVALENYFTNQNMNLVEEMNKQLSKLGCNDTNFVNTTGLHDDDHYTTLNDLLKIVMDVLSFEQGRELLETTSYKTEDNIRLRSTLKMLGNNKATILGGKTGFTDESGQSVIVLYKANNRSYILMIANAMGDPYSDEFWHFEDTLEIINQLY